MDNIQKTGSGSTQNNRIRLRNPGFYHLEIWIDIFVDCSKEQNNLSEKQGPWVKIILYMYWTELSEKTQAFS